ncbi:MAG: LysR family transcriptional regulator [Humidesulfovibrio sp.]|nr:LysR family transcriptional regulator [Humidesulfovibrio sp.]
MSAEVDRQPAVVRLHLWLERGGKTMLGLGKLQLLERIGTCGSIKSAADELGMSYRAAWGKLKASEEALGVPLIEKVGGNKSGCRLTPEGHVLAEAFRLWFAEVERHAADRANDLFPFLCRNFPDKKPRSLPADAASCVFQNI